MTYDTAQEILGQIDEDTKGDETLQKLRRQLFLAAIQYARIRTDWYMTPREGRLEMDQKRSAAHNAFIDTCNILSREMKKQHKCINWRQTLGEERKEIGDFACHLHTIIGIKAR